MQLGLLRVAAILAIALFTAGCNTTSQHAGGLQAGQGATVAFESIDGPPQPVFQRLVRKLNEEAEVRQVPVVTREGFAPYRVRGYVAVGVERGQATVAWVWDVYDTQMGRTVRLSGEEKAGKAGRDAWQSINDDVLRRIAGNGMEQLAAYFRGGAEQGGGSAPASPQAPSVAPDATSAVASNDNLRSEGQGTPRRPQEMAAGSAQPADLAPAARRRAAGGAGQVALANTQR